MPFGAHKPLGPRPPPPPFQILPWGSPAPIPPHPLLIGRYILQQKLKQMCLKVATMDLEACVRLLHDRHTRCPSPELQQELLVLVGILKRYRPFLPQSLFAELQDTPDTPAEAEQDEKSDAGAPHTVVIETGPALPDAEGARDALAPECSLPDQLPGLGLRKGTVLQCALDVAGPGMEGAAAAFLALVEAAAVATHGVVQAFGVGQATVTWNVFRCHPLHQAQACACALRLVAQQPRIRMVLVSAPLSAGVLGTDRMKAPVLHSAAVEVCGARVPPAASVPWTPSNQGIAVARGRGGGGGRDLL